MSDTATSDQATALHTPQNSPILANSGRNKPYVTFVFVVQALDYGCLEMFRFFFTRRLSANRDPTKVEIRYRDPIFFERTDRSRFFELLIVMLTHLSESESNHFDTKREKN